MSHTVVKPAERMIAARLGNCPQPVRIQTTRVDNRAIFIEDGARRDRKGPTSVCALAWCLVLFDNGVNKPEENNSLEEKIKVIQARYKDSLTQLQTIDQYADYFRIDLAFSPPPKLGAQPLLFTIIMDVLACELGSKPPESMLLSVK